MYAAPRKAILEIQVFVEDSNEVTSFAGFAVFSGLSCDEALVCEVELSRGKIFIDTVPGQTYYIFLAKADLFASGYGDTYLRLIVSQQIVRVCISPIFVSPSFGAYQF